MRFGHSACHIDPNIHTKRLHLWLSKFRWLRYKVRRAMKHDNRTDEELMYAIQSGDTHAFRLLFERYRTPLYHFLVRMIGHPETAADLTQDVFAKLLRNAASFHHRSRFSTWIYAIARNAALDAIRRAGHRRHPSLDQSTSEGGAPLVERIAASGPQPDRDAVARRLREALTQAIGQLPPEQREVFVLREYQGVSFQEIADVLQVPLGTVKRRMRYALTALRQTLKEYEDYARSLP